MVGDKGGCHVYNGTGEYQKTVKPKQMLGGKMYGILPVRRNGGQVGFICEKPNGDGLKYVSYDNTLSKVSYKFSCFLSVFFIFTFRDIK